MLDRIGNCRIVEEMAAGGMAVVYRAIQDGLERTVAIKALKSSASHDESLEIRFEREAQSLAKLQHENIIHVYGFLRERGAMFIIMEYVEGIDVYDLLERADKLPFDVAAIIALQVARALDYIHYRGILHRDIKPGNIMLSRQGGVKLMDFGIVQDRRFDDLTQTGTGIGTPSYMSPEQILSDPLDARSDLFSLGIVLYQMVTGEKPFVEDESRSVMSKIRLVQHVRAQKRNPSLPRELDRIIDKCLQKQPGDRWTSAQQLIMALERFLAKHVAINYHSRLVEFLRDEGIVPGFEAEEYLNPKLGGGPSSSVSPSRRRIMKRALWTQGGILLVVACMVGIIHLAPLGDDQAASKLAPPPVQGYVRVWVHPWGQLAIDGSDVGTTPIAAPLELDVGAHTLVVTHDAFAPFEQPIVIPKNRPDAPLDVRIDLEVVGVPRPSDGAAGDGPVLEDDPKLEIEAVDDTADDAADDTTGDTIDDAPGEAPSAAPSSAAPSSAATDLGDTADPAPTPANATSETPP